MSAHSETAQSAFYPSSVYSRFTDEAIELLASYVSVGVHPLINDKEEIRKGQEAILALGGVLIVVDLRPITESEDGKPVAFLVDALREWFENGREAWCKRHLPDVPQSAALHVLLFIVVPLNAFNTEQRSSSQRKTLLQVLVEQDTETDWHAPAGTGRGRLPDMVDANSLL